MRCPRRVTHRESLHTAPGNPQHLPNATFRHVFALCNAHIQSFARHGWPHTEYTFVNCQLDPAPEMLIAVYPSSSPSTSRPERPHVIASSTHVSRATKDRLPVRERRAKLIGSEQNHASV